MPLKKIYLVRHGQTKFNSLGVVQGRGINSSLDETGRNQAAMFHREYAEVPFERIYISALKRTFESVRNFISSGIPFEMDEGLDEISWGIHEGAEASEERNMYFRETVHAWKRGETELAIEGGESPQDVADRQKTVIQKIIDAPEELILVCMHGRAMRILLCTLLNLPLSEMDRFEHANLGLYVLEYNSSEFKLLESNSTDHFHI